jgi:hypothetical protein
VQEVRWDNGGTVRAGEYNFFYGQGNESHQLGTGFFVQQRITSAFKGVEFVSDRMSYTGCPTTNEGNFVRVFLMLNYTEITLTTYVQS